MCKQKRYPTNPIGVIALFISFCYGAATIVIGTNIENFRGAIERQPLIWFVIVFPIMVLGVFVFLVVRHHEKLYAPGDFESDFGFYGLTRNEKKEKEKETEKKQETLENMELKEISPTTTSQNDKPSLSVNEIESLIIKKLSSYYDRSFSYNETALIGKNGNRMFFDAVSIDPQCSIAVEIKFCSSNISDNQFVDKIRQFLIRAREEVSSRLMIILVIFTDRNNLDALESNIRRDFPQITTFVYTHKDLK